MFGNKSGTSADFWIRLGLAVVLFAMALAVFAPAVQYDFLNYDDDQYVSANPPVRQGLTADSLRWAFTSLHENWWLPLLWTSYMADTTLWGTAPFGYHLTNLLLHALNAALLFWAVSRMTGSRWRSFFVAALFALHPLRVESVAWIAARKDVLSGLFFLLALLAYLQQVEKPKSAWRWSLSLLMLLGLMSKAIVIILPFALLLLDVWPLRRAKALGGRAAWTQWRPLLAEKTLLFVLALAFVGLNLFTHRADSLDPAGLSLLDRLGLVFPNYWVYLRQVVAPVHLSLFYPENDVVTWPVSLAALAGLAALTGLAFHQRGKRPYLLVGWLWFLLALFPVIRGLRLGLAAYADRFTYLPSIGLGLAFAWTVADLWPRGRKAAAALAALAFLLLAACAGQTRATLPRWKDSLAAFGNVLESAPSHALPYNNYGQALVDSGRFQEALPYLEKAIAGAPRMTSFTANLGMALILLGRTDEALLRMDSVRTRMDPDNEILHFNTALAWMEKNEPRTAIPHFLRAIERDPRPIWRAELARAYREAGQREAFSNEMARVAAGGFPQLASEEGLCAYYLELWQLGKGRRSWTFFQRALAENPDQVFLLNNVAWFLATDPPAGASPAEALPLALRAKELAAVVPPGLLDTLAVAYAANGQFDEAIRQAEEAQALALSAGDSELAERIGERLLAYRSGKAWGKAGPVDR